MKKVLLHDQRYSIGGPKAVLDGIVASYLGEKYRFVRICQTEACGFNPIKAFKLVNKYRKLINRENADVIYICGLQYIGFLMTLAAKFSNVKKIVLSVHGSEWDIQNKGLREYILMYFFEPLEVFLADAVFTVCESAQRTVGALRIGCHGNNVGVVYNTIPSIDPEKVPSSNLRTHFGIGIDKIIVTSVGRVVETKGHQYIVEALKKLDDPRFIFVIVGDGPYLETIQALCEKEIAEGRLLLLGKRSDVYSLLKDSDIFLFPTLNENHSIALLEAVKMKCAVICTNVGGNPEIIEDGVSGLLIPIRNSDSIVEGLRKLESPKLRRQYALAAYRNAEEKFSVEKTYGKLDLIFNS